MRTIKHLLAVGSEVAAEWCRTVSNMERQLSLDKFRYLMQKNDQTIRDVDLGNIPLVA